MTALVEVRNAGFSYGRQRIFAGIDLDVEPGEVLTVLGANGCGKSTLLRCIGGALSLNEGSVRVDGELLSTLAPDTRARRVGFLFQDHAPIFPYRVVDVVCMGRAPYLRALSAPSRADMRLADEALARIGIAALRERPYTALSGGERQLVLLARCLVQSPRVLLLDEPTSHLDWKNQVRCLDVIGVLAGQGMAMIMTTHDPNHAVIFSQRAALMSAGRLTVGPVREVMSAASLSRTYDTPIRQVSQDPPIYVPG